MPFDLQEILSQVPWQIWALSLLSCVPLSTLGRCFQQESLNGRGAHSEASRGDLPPVWCLSCGVGSPLDVWPDPPQKSKTL